MRKKFSRLMALILGLMVMSTTLYPDVAFAAELEQTDNFIEEIPDVGESPGTNEQEEAEEPEPTEVDFVNSTQEVADNVDVKNESVVMLSGEDAYASLSMIHPAAIVAYDGLYVLTYESTDAMNSDITVLNDSGYRVSVEKNESVETNAATTIPENGYSEDFLKNTGIGGDYSKFYLDAESGQEVKVAVIDTGIETSHLDANRAVINDSYNFIDNSGNVADKNSHGTYMAQIILNYTPDTVKVLPMKAVGDDGVGTVLSVYLAIKAAIEEKVDVINISLSNEGESQMLTDVICKAYDANIPVVVSAGNNASQARNYIPGNVEKAITVSAVNTDLSLEKYSNYGDVIDYSAYGRAKVIDSNGNDLYISGTSVSAAYASIAFAMNETYQKDLSVDMTKNIVTNNVSDIGDSGRDNYFGEGLINLSDYYFGDTSRSEREEEANKKVEEANDPNYTVDDATQELYTSRNIKNKYFYVTLLGDNNTQTGKTDSFYLGVRDSDAYTELGWNHGGRIDTWYSYVNWGFGDMYTMNINMVNLDVTDWTPYIYIKTMTRGASPTGWNASWGATGMSGWNGTQVHNFPDQWKNDSCSIYVGAGFCADFLYPNWVNNKYTINCNLNGCTSYDEASYNYVKWVYSNIECNAEGNIANSDWFSRAFNVTYNANGGSASKSSETCASTFLGWDDNIESIQDRNGYFASNWGDMASPNGGFNYAYYANHNPDLRNFYGYDKASLAGHLWTNGFSEGRSYDSGHRWSAGNIDANDLLQPGVRFKGLSYTNGETVTLTTVWGDNQVILPTASRAGYALAGWYTTVDGREVWVGNPGDRVTISSNQNLYAKWTATNCTIKFDGNGATGGSTASITAAWSGTVNMPNGFVKADAAYERLNNRQTGNEVAYHAYKFDGWSLNKNDTFGTYADYGTYTVSNIAAAAGVGPGGTITLYAIWNESPEITAQDMYFSLEDAQSGRITEDTLTWTAHAKDREDRSISVKLINFSKEEFMALTDEATVTETYEACDSRYNHTYRTITVHIVDTTAKIPIEYQAKIRHISAKYMDKPAAEGGFAENSIWQTPEYKSALAEVLNNTKENVEVRSKSVLGIDVTQEVQGSGTWKKAPEQSWTFSAEDIDSAKEYIETHGFGNYQESDGLKNFLIAYASNRTL